MIGKLSSYLPLSKPFIYLHIHNSKYHFLLYHSAGYILTTDPHSVYPTGLSVVHKWQL